MDFYIFHLRSNILKAIMSSKTPLRLPTPDLGAYYGFIKLIKLMVNQPYD